MSNPTEFLTAALDAAEVAARGAAEDASYLTEGGEHWRVDQNKVSAPGGTISWETGQSFSAPLADHVAANDPAHVLRMVAAHRKLLAIHKPEPYLPYAWSVCGVCVDEGDAERWAVYPCPTIKTLAEAYGWEQA